MSQSKKMSFAESWVNIGIGFSINLTANALIFPLFGFEITIEKNLGLGVIYTFISLARSYTVRRWFNKKEV